MKADVSYTSASDIFETLEAVRLAKFPEGTWDKNISKAKEECDEVLLTGQRSKRLVEYCDVLTCTINAARADGFSPHEIVAALLYKAAVNSHRKQAIRADGLYQHVDE